MQLLMGQMTRFDLWPVMKCDDPASDPVGLAAM